MSESKNTRQRTLRVVHIHVICLADVIFFFRSTNFMAMRGAIFRMQLIE